MPRWSVLRRGKVLGFVHADAFQDALEKAREAHGQDVRVGAPADPTARTSVQRHHPRTFDQKED